MNTSNLYVEKTSDSENSFCNVTAGCYLIQDGLIDENSGVIPIYHSICKLVPRKNGYDSTYRTAHNDRLDDNNAQGYQYVGKNSRNVMVLPGFQVRMYRHNNYSDQLIWPNFSSTLVNTEGKDVKIFNLQDKMGYTTTESLKLFHKGTDNKVREVFPYVKRNYPTRNGGNIEVHVRPSDPNPDGSAIALDQTRYTDNETITYSGTTYKLLRIFDVARIRYTNPSVNDLERTDVSGLVVGGGGSSGQCGGRNNGTYYHGAGGGGGGGYVEGNISLKPNTIYEIRAGRGGAGMNYTNADYMGMPGESSVITNLDDFEIIAYGGGAGSGNRQSDGPVYKGNVGGSSGGKSYYYGGNHWDEGQAIKGQVTKPATDPTSMLSYGNNGTKSGNNTYLAGGSGGGAGSNGYEPTNSGHNGGHGGSGKQWIDGITYAGGGAGGGVNTACCGYYSACNHGGGNAHGRGGGGSGTIGWNFRVEAGYSGVVCLAIPQ